MIHVPEAGDYHYTCNNTIYNPTLIFVFSPHQITNPNIPKQWCGGNDNFKTVAKPLTETNTNESAMDGLAGFQQLGVLETMPKTCEDPDSNSFSPLEQGNN